MNSRNQQVLLLLALLLAIGSGLWLALKKPMDTGQRASLDERRAIPQAANAELDPAAASADTKVQQTPPKASAREALTPAPQSHPGFDESAQAPPPRLVVRVTDSLGAPVEGVGLKWMAERPVDSLPRIPGRSKSNGLLVVRGDHRLLDAHFDPERAPAGLAKRTGRIGLRTNRPFDKGQATDIAHATHMVWLDAEPIPGQPIELVLPPTGVLDVSWDLVQDALGRPLKEYTLQVHRTDGAGPDRLVSTTRTHSGVTRAVVAGIGLNWELQVVVFAFGVDNAAASDKLAGPTQPGEVLRHELTLFPDIEDLVSFRGRVVGSDGEPAANVRLKVEITGAFGQSPGLRVLTTSDEGRFEATLPRSKFGTEATFEHFFDPRKPSAQVKLDLQADESVADIGTIELRPTLPPAQALAQGVVLGSSGAPLAGALVYAQARVSSHNGVELRGPDFPNRVVASAPTDSQGAFALEAIVEIPSGELELRVHKNGYVRSVTSNVEVGAQALQLTLERACTVTVRTHLPEWAQDYGQVITRLIDKDGAIVDNHSAPPGIYTVQLITQASLTPLWEQVVDVQANLELGPIDLTESISLCAVRLTRSNGEALANSRVVVADALTGQQVGLSHTDDHGRVACLIPRAVASILIRPQGLSHSELSTASLAVPKAGVAPDYVPVVLNE